MGGISLISSPDGGVDTAYGPTGFPGLVKEPVIVGLSIFTSLGGVLFGYDQGVISGVLVMDDFLNTFPSFADSTMKGWVTSVLTLGAMFGALINGPIADRFSRRWSICLASIVFILGSVLQAAAVNTTMMFVGRSVAGVSVGMLSMVVPLYISELAPPNLRGALVSLQQLGITVGIMVAFWLNYGTAYIRGSDGAQSPAAWRVPLAIQCAPALVLAIGSTVLPYSPRWLILKDREDEAVGVLSRIRRVPPSDWRLQREVLEIKTASLFDKKTIEEKYPAGMSPFWIAVEQYRELVTVPHLRRRLRIACMLQIIQQFTGINAIIYYAPTIFKDIGLSGNSVNLLATGVVGVINFIMTWPAILLLDRVGRKTILIAGGIGMGIAQLLVATIYAVYKDRWADHKTAGWTAAVFIWVYIANFAYSIGCVNWLLPSEIFPPAKRAKAVGISIGTNWLSNFVVGLVVPHMLETITFGTFYFFLAFCLILIGWVKFFVPESRGVRIEELDKSFGGNDGEMDIRRMNAIRQQLALEAFAENMKALGPGDASAQYIE